MKFVSMALLISLAAVSHSERFITINMGRKVPYRSVKLNSLSDIHDFELGSKSLGFAFGNSFDGEVVYENDGNRKRTSLDLAYNLNDPLIGYGPGFSAGIRDVANESINGREIFAVFTHHLGNVPTHVQNVPTMVTYGFLHGREGMKMFVGAQFPFSEHISLVMEHNSHDLIGGLELRPVPDGSLRWLHKQGAIMVQVSYLQRF